MKRFLTSLCLLILLLPAQQLRATEYANSVLRFTLPEAFSVKPCTTAEYEGFEASNSQLKLLLFTLSYTESINLRNNLKIEDAQWLMALKEATLTDTRKPIGRRYDRVSTYRMGDRQIRVYRYVAARSLAFLVAESRDGNWEQADAVARSQRYQKNFKFFIDNFNNGLIRFILWCALLSGAGIILFNLVEKHRNGRFLLITIPTLLLCAAGVRIFGWPLSMESLLFGIWPAALVAALVGGSDQKAEAESDADIDDPTTYDGTGPTIHHEL